MIWLMAIDIAEVGKSVLKTLWNKDGPSVYPDPDLARNALLTGVTFLFGWIVSLRGSRRKMRERIVDELLMTQRELGRRAYPDEFGGEWRQDDPREIWMLAPLVSRIQFLVATLNDEKSVSRDTRTLMDVYVESVTDFIAEWARTKTRFNGASFESKFLKTYDLVIVVAKSIGPLESGKRRGLLPKRFQMRTNFDWQEVVAKRGSLIHESAPSALTKKVLVKAD